MENDFVNAPLYWNQRLLSNRAFAFDAFVSHASGDDSTKLVELFRLNRVEVWHDESQIMGDSRWSMRLVQALLRSRYVVLVINDEHKTLERDWVIAEWKSALEAEQQSEVSRLVIAKWSENVYLPPEFSKCPQYLISRDIDELTQLLKNGNLLPKRFKALPPDPDSIISKGLAALPEFLHPEDEKDLTKIVYNLTRKALLNIQISPNSPPYELYQLFLLSHYPEAISSLDFNLMESVLKGLESLAITGHYEGRANACFMLKGLAKGGYSAAGDVLMQTLRKQDHSDVLREVFRWFVYDKEQLPALTPKDYTRILLILPPVDRELADKAISSALPEADAAKLRHFVFRVTYKHFEELTAKAKFAEAKSRFKYMLKEVLSPSQWEVFFRELSSQAELKIPLVNLEESLPEEKVNTFLLFVERFADEFINNPYPIAWIMEYEVAVLRPLAIASAYEQFYVRASSAYYKFLNLLATPVRRDLKLIEEWQKDASDSDNVEYLELLRDALEFRLRVISYYLKGPYLEKTDSGQIRINLVSVDDSARLLMFSDKVEKRQLYVESSFDSLIADSDKESEDLSINAIWKRWKEIPLV